MSWLSKNTALTPAESAERRIALLLEEYRSLRADLVQRTASHASLLGFLVAAVALITRPEDFKPGAWMAMVLVVLVIGLVYWVRSQQITKDLGARVADIEDALNQLATIAYGQSTGEVGSKAELQWESELRKREPR